MPSLIRGCRLGGRPTAAAATTAVLLLAGCADRPVDEPPAAPQDQPVAASFEEAALVALGELFRIHGSDATPAPIEVTGEIVTHRGQRVWRLDGTYQVTIDDQPEQQQWTLWIGPTEDSPLSVVAVDGPG